MSPNECILGAEISLPRPELPAVSQMRNGIGKFTELRHAMWPREKAFWQFGNKSATTVIGLWISQAEALRRIDQ